MNLHKTTFGAGQTAEHLVEVLNRAATQKDLAKVSTILTRCNANFYEIAASDLSSKSKLRYMKLIKDSAVKATESIFFTKDCKETEIITSLTCNLIITKYRKFLDFMLPAHAENIKANKLQQRISQTIRKK